MQIHRMALKIIVSSNKYMQPMNANTIVLNALSDTEWPQQQHQTTMVAWCEK